MARRSGLPNFHRRAGQTPGHVPRPRDTPDWARELAPIFAVHPAAHFQDARALAGFGSPGRSPVAQGGGRNGRLGAVWAHRGI